MKYIHQLAIKIPLRPSPKQTETRPKKMVLGGPPPQMYTNVIQYVLSFRFPCEDHLLKERKRPYHEAC